MFNHLTQRFDQIFTKLKGQGKLSEADLSATLGEAKVALLEADVSVEVVNNLLERIRTQAREQEVSRSLSPGQQIIKLVHEELTVTLGTQPSRLSSGDPQVVLMVGLQGSGKTTTSAKLAQQLMKQNRNPLLVAADLARPAAVEQLQRLGQQIGVPVYPSTIPRNLKVVRLVKEAMSAAKTAKHQTVIVDTAGRLEIDQQMMRELGEINKVVQAQETLLVLDAMTGQTAIEVARGFSDRVYLTGLIITKLDGDARGGAAISVREETGVPIKYIGTGEKLDDLELFHPDRLASRILGMGDVLTLIEKAEAEFDKEIAQKTFAKLQQGTMNLEDFMQAQQEVKKMGPLAQMYAMIPGAQKGQIPTELDEAELRKTEAIIRSMTPAERRDDKLIRGSRRRRIAAGSGTQPVDVNRVIKQFREVKQVMQLVSTTGNTSALNEISKIANLNKMNRINNLSSGKKKAGPKR